MKILEKTIFKKKNQEIENLKKELIEIADKSRFNYEKNRQLNLYISQLEDKIFLLENDKKELEDRIKVLNGVKGGLTKENNKLNRIIEEERNTFENDLKIANNEILKLKKKIEELSSDRYLVKKLKPTKTKTQKMGIKNGYIQGKIINKIKESE